MTIGGWEAAGGKTAEWRVRPALPEEEGQVVALWESCGLVASYNDPGADFRMALHGPSSTVLVGNAAAGGPVLGSVMTGHDGHRGWLYYVAAAPAVRGRGLGRTMVRAGEAWLQANGVPKAQLLVRETNPAVISFYEAMGYEVATRTVMGKWLR